MNKHVEKNQNQWKIKIEQFLARNGANYMYNSGKQISADVYIQICMTIALCNAACIILLLDIYTNINIFIEVMLSAFGGIIVGIFIPQWVITYGNKQSNNEMLDDIAKIYRELFLQLDAGVFITEAFAECRQVVKIGRLKTAITEFNGTVRITADMDAAIDEFEMKFNNFYITILCMALRQLQKNGRNLTIIRDMEKQMKNVQQQLRLQETEKLEMKSMLIQFFVLVMTVIIMTLFIFLNGDFSFINI